MGQANRATLRLMTGVIIGLGVMMILIAVGATVDDDDDAPTIEVEFTPEVTPEATDEVFTSACVWQWAQEPQPDLSERLNAAVAALDLPVDADLSAYAYGENCLDAGGALQGFYAMETDFVLELRTDEADDDALGTTIAAIAPVLAEHPPDTTPGPRAGRLEVTVTSSGEVVHRLIAPYEDVIGLDITGAAVIDALGGWAN
jgi:hypothetical protein